jgi:hypothetical protein
MPNVKFFIEESLLREKSAHIDELLNQTRETIIAGLGVTLAACHIVVLGVRSLTGQTPVNIELVLLQNPGRTRDVIERLCGQLRDTAVRMLDVPSAVRCAMTEPETYIVIRPG